MQDWYKTPYLYYALRIDYLYQQFYNNESSGFDVGWLINF